MTDKLTERRESLERKVLAIFHAAHDMPETYGSSIGKYDVKRTLEFSDKTLRVSINTIKRIVERMVCDGVVECINPEYKCGLRFRLAYYNDSLDSFSLAVKAWKGEDCRDTDKKEVKDES